MSAESASAAARALDDLLATLQHCGLCPLELRILIRLAEREAAQLELADALQARSETIRRAIRGLAMRGLIARRFEGGPRSRFVLSITSSGLAAVAPLAERVAKAQPAGDDGLCQVVRSAVGMGGS